MIENTLFDQIEVADKGDDVPDTLINWDRFSGKRIVLYTGTFEFYQGLPMLLQAIKMIVAQQPDVNFILIGGTPEQVSDMRRMAADLGIKQQVVFTGNLTPNTVKCFIKRADVLVSPRVRGNNSPLKIYEYLASGKPIVATAHETHTQILSPAEAVLTAPEPAAFAEGILRVLREPKIGGDIVENARTLYLRAYSEQVYVAKLRQMLEQLDGASFHLEPSSAGVKGK